MDKEPAVILGAITALAAAILAALVAFGMDINDAQQTAILTLLATLAPIVLAIVTRSKVFALANVVAQVDSQGLVVAGPALLTVDNGLPVDVTPAV